MIAGAKDKLRGEFKDTSFSLLRNLSNVIILLNSYCRFIYHMLYIITVM